VGHADIFCYYAKEEFFCFFGHKKENLNKKEQENFQELLKIKIFLLYKNPFIGWIVSFITDVYSSLESFNFIFGRDQD
jgi:hypothetical protein